MRKAISRQTAHETANNVAYQRAILNLTVPKIRFALHDISEPPDGVNQFFGKRLIDLFTQAAHSRFHNIGLRVEIVLPHMLHDHGLGNHSARISGQVFQKRKLQRLNVNPFAAPINFARQQVNHQVPYGQRGGFRAGTGPAQQRLNPRDQFGE